MRYFVRWIFAASFVVAAGALSATEDFYWIPQPTRNNLKKLFMDYRRISLRALGRTSSGNLLDKAEKIRIIQPLKSQNFPCSLEDGKSEEIPDSVHKLRPGDIRVIGALGDSLTAGYGAAATSLLTVLVQNRGLSWSIGGQGTWDKFLTLPNMLKMYNPDLIGQALGDSNSFEWNAQFNVAEGAAMTHDMPYMAKHLVKRITSDSRVNVTTDWKMITIMIGGNDYCSDMCYYNVDKYLARRKRMLLETMDILLESLPRTFVNMVVSPNVADVLPRMTGTATCWITQRLECPCVLGPAFTPNRKEYVEKVREAQLMEIEIANMEKYQREDFAIVAQPFLMEIEFPKTPDGLTDLSYLSQDCFHMSQKCYSRAANSLWNNLFEPVGNKSKSWTREFEKFVCPSSEHPYIYTAANSK